MRILFTGVSPLFTKQFIDSFTTRWQNYTEGLESFTTPVDMVDINSQEEQWDSLNAIVDELQTHRKGEHVYYLGGSLDNLIYSIWANAKNENIDDDFIQKCMPIVSESMRFIDVIYYIPVSKYVATEVSSEYDEIRNLYTSVTQLWQEDSSPLFPKDDRPPIIELVGGVDEQLELMSLYMDEDGDAIGAQGIIDPGELEELEKAFGIK